MTQQPGATPESAVSNETMQADTPKTHSMDDGTTMSDEEHAMMMEIEKSAQGAQSSGVYELYAADKIARASSGPVVLFFRASWCPTCQAADKDIRANAATIPSGVVILDVDYDNSADLKKKYGVTYQHTFVQVDASGNQIAKWSGSRTLSEVVKNIKS